MRNSIVVDASVLVAAVLPSEPGHWASANLLAYCARTATIMMEPSIAIPELLGAVARRSRTLRLVREVLQGYRASSIFTIVPVDEPLADAAGEIALRQALRGADAVYVALADELGVPLITWDREQQGRAPTHLEVLTPEQALEHWQRG